MKILRHRSLAEAEINLTPMIDVCFVVLIMFIVVAPILEMEQVELASGPPLDQNHVFSLSEKSPVTIHVHRDDTITVNQRPILLKDLVPLLSCVKQQHPTATPQLYHDRNAKFGTYQSIKNAIESVGFKEMDVILRPE